MTTIVSTRQRLGVFEMSHQRERRTSKRLASAAPEFEQDGDFQFSRGPKRAKTTAAAEPQTEPIPEDAPLITTTTAAARRTVGRPAKQTRAKRAAPVDSPPLTHGALDLVTPERAPVPKRRSGRLSAQLHATSEEKSPDQPENDLVMLKKRGRRPPDAKTTKDRPPPTITKWTAARSTTAAKGALPPDDESSDVGGPATAMRREEHPSAEPERLGESEIIRLPVSDTPVIERNKEMRRNGGAGGFSAGGGGGRRRSSLGIRGRRASSLMGKKQSAIPHREVPTDEYYRHIEALTDPARMMQLLLWSGDRAETECSGHEGGDSRKLDLRARAIQGHLEDVREMSKFSDWYNYKGADEAEKAKPPDKLLPNPKNEEIRKKVAQLETRTASLKIEKKEWKAAEKYVPQVEPLFPTGTADQSWRPDESLLDPEEAQILAALSDPSNTSRARQQDAQSRINDICANLESKVSELGSNVHNVHRSLGTSIRLANTILESSQKRLKAREVQEKTAAGTRDLPTMEVLRSLSRMLPDNGG